jgi:hypothetical protein
MYDSISLVESKNSSFYCYPTRFKHGKRFYNKAITEVFIQMKPESMCQRNPNEVSEKFNVRREDAEIPSNNMCVSESPREFV